MDKWILEKQNANQQLNNESSNQINISCGLLQGDNLSQSFFSLVINNIIREIKFCGAHLYADDLAVYLETDISNFENAINKINDDIGGINDYISRHGMQLNPVKKKEKKLVIRNLYHL